MKRSTSQNVQPSVDGGSYGTYFEIFAVLSRLDAEVKALDLDKKRSTDSEFLRCISREVEQELEPDADDSAYRELQAVITLLNSEADAIDRGSKPASRNLLHRLTLDIRQRRYGVPETSSVIQTESPDKPLPRQRAQEMAILKEVQSMDLDPQKLPRGLIGKPGPKNAISKTVSAKHPDLFSGSTVFDKAWERMVKSGQIKWDAPLPQTGG